MRKIRLIVSVDGGGIRGIIPLKMMSYLDQLITQRTNQSLNSLIDGIAGTSTGSVIGASLIVDDSNGNVKYKPQDILNLYIERGPQIFSMERAENELPFNLVLENSFGTITLKELRKHFLFVSYDQLLNKPFIITDFDKKYEDIQLTKVLMASCAIPEYFPSVKLDGKELIDGIFAAKNPSLLGFEYAKIHFPNDVILMYSFGTGIIPSESQDDIDREVNRVHHELMREANNNPDFIYYRFEPELSNSNVPMDDTSERNINELIETAENFIQPHQTEIQESVQKLLILKQL